MWAINIPQERTFGTARCCCVGAQGLSLHEALAAFGLEQRDDRLIEVTPHRGTVILEQILAQSFVDGLEAMPRQRAFALAKEFVDALTQEGCRFFTNGEWARPEAYTWQPFTHSVYDGGLIAHGPSLSACVWIEEDD
jgi:hypothetical protein